ncbi:MAG: saccharopine dehydrogenase [Linnemannia gamsii]|nr:MAG: saccharopine dehydrogenase [Linnemannia gamsii]
MTAREYDLIIYGATGFTGLRTCQYLARNYTEGVRWAIAGRSVPKLEEVREKLVAINPALSSLPIIKADASSPGSLETMTAQTKVVISTVGPFMQYGEPLVAACIKEGTHYVDSTGESPFVNNIIHKYHQEAVDKNVILVPQCGFDSVPSDIGTKMVVDFIRKEYGLSTKSVKMSLLSFRGAASGGTLASLCNIMAEKQGGVGAMVDQNQLVPESVQSKVLPAKISIPAVHYDYDFQKWQTYFVMSSSNEKIVKRSHGLALEGDGNSYGPQFTYGETMSAPGLVSAATAAIGMGLGGAALTVGPLRRFIQNRFMPAPGEGPSEESIAKGRFTIHVIGESVLPENVEGSSEEAKPVRALAVIQGGDPGYAETCRYLVEGALCLVKSEDQVRSENKVKGGILTPAHAFGQILVRRLQDRNVNLTVSKL